MGCNGPGSLDLIEPLFVSYPLVIEEEGFPSLDDVNWVVVDIAKFLKPLYQLPMDYQVTWACKFAQLCLDFEQLIVDMHSGYTTQSTSLDAKLRYAVELFQQPLLLQSVTIENVKDSWNPLCQDTIFIGMRLLE